MTCLLYVLKTKIKTKQINKRIGDLKVAVHFQTQFCKQFNITFYIQLQCGIQKKVLGSGDIVQTQRHAIKVSFIRNLFLYTLSAFSSIAKI